MFLGLRTAIYPAPNLAESKAWFTRVLGVEPYFDEPFYVGFNVAGYELGLLPDADPAHGVLTYWGVPDADEAVAALTAAGATPGDPVTNVGDGIRTATVRLPGSECAFGVIQNPHFHSGRDQQRGLSMTGFKRFLLQGNVIELAVAFGGPEVSGAV
jgi:catechol 2,3-dioxygenase-like lactoylglutathione lyase family enzyme